MNPPSDVRRGDSCLTSRDLLSLHAGEVGWVEDVFDNGVSLHFPVNPTGFEFWSWDEIEAHYPLRRETMKTDVDVRQATHVKIGGQYIRIKSKYGISPDGRLAKPSEGGFGVFTEDGQHISMWEAQAYGREE